MKIDLLDRLSADHLRTRRDDAIKGARQSLRRARSEAVAARETGLFRVWTARLSTVQGALSALDRAPEKLEPVVKPLKRALDEQLVHLTALPIENYDALNARDAIQALAELSRVELECVARYETAHKSRKTVLAAVSRRVETLGGAVA